MYQDKKEWNDTSWCREDNSVILEDQVAQRRQRDVGEERLAYNEQMPEHDEVCLYVSSPDEVGDLSGMRISFDLQTFPFHEVGRSEKKISKKNIKVKIK